MDKRTITLAVNGQPVTREIETRQHPADFLRHDLRPTGPPLACEHGVCGACTVLVDGAPVSSCTYLAVEAAGRDVATVEGLADGDDLHPLQQAFIERGAVQCGFCTPGMLMAAKALIDEFATPTAEDVAAYLRGNVCRCTGYRKVIEAVMACGKPPERQA